MYNDFFTIGDFTIHSYGVMIAVGILCAYFVSVYRAKKKHLDADKIFSLLIWALAGGFIGAKLLYYITIFNQIISDPSLLLDVSNGFVVYGGIIGGTISCYIYCRHSKLSFIEYSDLLLPSVSLAQGFGRIGCLLSGCCYGAPTSSAFAIVFHNSEMAPNGVPLIPTQPVSSILDFINFGILLIIARRGKKKGIVTSCYLIFYSIGRFIIEFFRGDMIRGNIGVLSTSQIISLVILVVGLGMMYYISKTE